MPKQYEDIRDSLIARGTPVKKAKQIAAATYNKHHPNRPMTRQHPEGGPRKKSKK